MKKIVASVGLVALGASSFQSSASAQDVVSPDSSKPWSVAATLRGFYDDNISTIPNDQVLAPGQHRDVVGYEVTPSATLNWALQQTTISLGALYSFKYYDRTPINSTEKTDQTFTFNGDLTHSFSDEYKARLADGFVIGQEPDTLRAGNTYSTFQRIPGDNIRNFASASFDAQFSPKLGASIGYDNAFYDYKAKGASLGSPVTFPGPPPTVALPVEASPAGALNRDENNVHIEGLYTLSPQTKLLLGYSFAAVDFTGNELIGGYVDPLNPGVVVLPVMSSGRNYYEHRVYIGAEHNFSPQMTGNIRAGASYTDYYNDPTTDPSYTPYVVGDLKYTYAPDSYIDFGFSYDRNTTDVIGLSGNGSYTTDAQTAVAFLTLNHRITPQLNGSLIAEFQNNIYHGGIYENDTEQYYTLGLNLQYHFNQYVSAEVGYNYDRLESRDIGRTYDRNRVYIGVTAAY
jgi:hypothetical protein